MAPHEQDRPLSPPEKQAALDAARNALMPAIPKAFIVVKDVNIILTSTLDWGSQSVKDLQKAMSAGGGILCFSCAKSESSSEHRTAAAVSHQGDHLSIRIPAPQIIGWIQDITHPDLTQSAYTSLKESEFVAATLPERLHETAPAVHPVPPPPIEV
jgi:hypothetical protein